METRLPTREHPLLIFDGKCGFCRIWIDYWKLLTAGRVDYAPSQEVRGEFPQIPVRAYSESVQLVRTDGTVVGGARAVFESLGQQRWYESSRVFAALTEAAYRFIASHRNLAYQVTRFTFGKKIEPAQFALTQWIFLRLLAAVYAIAFGSLALQITGLIGAQGISPAQQFLERVAGNFGSYRYVTFPTIFWISASDAMLQGACIAGILCAALVFAGYLERAALAAAFVLYLSLSQVGQEFLSFQWDSLLLEAGFLAIFFARSAPGLRTVAWLYRCLVFRLYFLSGAVKLASHDPNWSSLTALDFHFHTQPLPTVFAWYADKLPVGVLHGATWATLAIELGAPFLIFGPRLWRLAGAWCLITLQAIIFLTGNYTFFNLLTLALTLFLFDDQALRRFSNRSPGVRQERRRASRIAAALLVVFVITTGLVRIAEALGQGVPPPLDLVASAAAPFQVVNTYGLFAVMTTERREIIVEGSNDGEEWLPYEFRYKPGDVNAAPRWAQPHQPRLDWQMWFAALGDYRSNPWFASFIVRLLEGSPAVLSLLEKNPFPDRPPRYIRAVSQEYSFTSFSERRQSGAWWKRSYNGTYMPAVALKGAAEAVR